MRVSGSRQTHDACNTDGSDDLDRYAGRVQFLFEPSDTLSIRLAGDFTHVGGVGAGGDYLGHYQGGNFIPSNLPIGEGMNTAAANAYRTTVLGAPGFGFLTPMNRQQSIDADYWGVHAEVTLETGIGELTFIPAYRETDSVSWFYGPAFNTAVFDEEFQQVSAELRLAGSVGPFDYIVGGFFFDEDVGGRNQFNQEFVLPIQDFTGGTTSYAGFSQLTFNVSDNFRLLAGARFTRDEKFIDGEITNFITLCGGVPPTTPPNSFAIGCAGPNNLPRYPNFTDPQAAFDWLKAQGFIASTSTMTSAQTQFFPIIRFTPPPPNAIPAIVNGPGNPDNVSVIQKAFNPVVDSGTFEKLTWKLSAEYDVGPDSLLYATVETGYRAGGFQLAESLPSYDPESITAFTIGSKNRFFDDRLQINLEAFYWRYKDQQITFFTVSPLGTLVNANQNVGRANIKGLEADAIFRVARNTTVSARMQYLDTVYKGLNLYTAAPRDNFNCARNSVLYGQDPRYPATTANPAGTVVRAGGNPVVRFDCSGNPLLYSPKWSFGVGLEQVIPISASFEAVARVDTQWQDEQWGNFNFLAQQLIPAYWTSNLNLSLNNLDSDWSLTLFVNNLENERQIGSAQASPIGFAVARRTSPRTWGLRLSADF